MSKFRAPETFAAAITRIMGLLGDERCAQAAGKSASLVRKWADPDHDCLPNLEQALSLDTACLCEWGSAPIMAVYAERMEAAAQFSSAPPPLKDAALCMQAAVGEFANAVLRARAPSSPEGRALSAAEKKEICAVLDAVNKQIGQAAKAVGHPPKRR